MVKHESGYLRQKNKNHSELFFNLFTPKEEPVIATVIILHGMKEHSGRYKKIARFLCKNKVAVLTYDHMGHGKSVKNEKSLGHFQNRGAVQQLITDAETMTDYLQKLHPDAPHFILGHSMGSFITRLLLQKSHNKFDGAIIVGTGGKNRAASASKPLFNLLNVLAPEKRSNFINNLFDKMNNARFKNEPGGSSTSWLSLNKENRLSFDNDPLCGVPFSNNGFQTLISANRSATKNNWAKNIPRHFPILFVSGANDPIGDFGNGIQKTIDSLKQNKFTDVEMLLYPDMRHEILNEDIQKEVFNDILRWINKHIRK